MSYLIDPFPPTVVGARKTNTRLYAVRCLTCVRHNDLLWVLEWVDEFGEYYRETLCAECARRMFGEHLRINCDLPEDMT